MKNEYCQEGTDFQKKVWSELLKIKKGSVITYKDLAGKIGKSKAIRAVANAVAKNKLLVIVPCHRVIRSDQKIGGYSGKGGIKTKMKLLKSEGIDISRLSL